MKIYKFWGNFEIELSSTFVYEDDDEVDETCMAEAILEDLTEYDYNVKNIKSINSNYEEIDKITADKLYYEKKPKTYLIEDKNNIYLN